MVLVFEEDEETFICHAYDPNRTGIDRAEVAARARAYKAAADREGREYATRLKHDYRPEGSMQRVLEHKRAQAEKVTTFPRRTEEHTTPALDEAARAAEEAAERPETQREERGPEKRELSPYLKAFKAMQGL